MCHLNMNGYYFRTYFSKTRGKNQFDQKSNLRRKKHFVRDLNLCARLKNYQRVVLHLHSIKHYIHAI